MPVLGSISTSERSVVSAAQSEPCREGDRRHVVGPQPHGLGDRPGRPGRSARLRLRACSRPRSLRRPVAQAARLNRHRDPVHDRTRARRDAGDGLALRVGRPYGSAADHERFGRPGQRDRRRRLAGAQVHSNQPVGRIGAARGLRGLVHREQDGRGDRRRRGHQRHDARPAPPPPRRRDRPAPAPRSQGRVLRKDSLLQLAQLRAQLQSPAPTAKRRCGVAVGRERVRLPSGPVERQHELTDRAAPATAARARGLPARRPAPRPRRAPGGCRAAPRPQPSRRSSSRSASGPAKGSNSRSARAGPRQTERAASSASRARLRSPEALASRASASSRSKRSRSSSPGSTRRRYPGARRSMRFSPSSRRRRDTWLSSERWTVGGARSPQSASTRRSRDTISFRASSSTVSNARCLGPPRATSDPSRRASTGPRIAKSMRPSKTALQGDCHTTATSAIEAPPHEKPSPPGPRGGRCADRRVRRRRRPGRRNREGGDGQAVVHRHLDPGRQARPSPSHPLARRPRRAPTSRRSPS